MGAREMDAGMRERGGRRVVLRAEEGAERREVALVAGPSLAVVEESSGPATEVAYGSSLHGHKVVLDALSCQEVFGVGPEQVADAVAAFFAGEGQPLLSDLMDVLDVACVPYSYASWSSEGDAIWRPRAGEGHPREPGQSPARLH